MKHFSKAWLRSKKARKQRKYRANAPLHLRQKNVSVHLDKKLRAEVGKRSMQIRKEDEVIVMRGEYRGQKGSVIKVDLKKMKVHVDKIKRKKVSGQEVQVPLDPSNLMITRLNLDDKKRRKFIDRKKVSDKNEPGKKS